MNKTGIVFLVCALGPALAACGSTKEEPGPSTGTCTSGKCDGFASTVEDYYSDMRSITLDDLVVVGMGLATDQFNDLLSDIPYADIRLSETELFGSERKLFGQTVVHDINELKTGLTEALGEHAFASQITEVCRNFLNSAPTAVYAETHFRVGASIDPSWTVDVGGLPAVLGIFINPHIETVVVAPYDTGGKLGLLLHHPKLQVAADRVA